MGKKKEDLARRYRVEKRKKFRLSDDAWDPGDTAGLRLDEESAGERLADGVRRLETLQARLYAQDRWALLLLFQAMDAAGKDSTIKHVLSGVNPQGCQVYSFKQPSTEELEHDFLWRSVRALPERGRIGIFNRSYYEEVLVVRVHEDLLKAEKIPDRLVGRKIWKQRYEDINAFERHLVRSGTVVLKFFLNVSRKEQKKRLLARLDDPDKNWKFSSNDAKERGFWNDYMDAYEQTIRETATGHAPWYVVPADNKWFTRVVVAAAVITALASLDLAYPRVGQEKLEELETVRRALTGGNGESEKHQRAVSA